MSYNSKYYINVAESDKQARETIENEIIAKHSLDRWDGKLIFIGAWYSWLKDLGEIAKLTGRTIIVRRVGEEFPDVEYAQITGDSVERYFLTQVYERVSEAEAGPKEMQVVACDVCNLRTTVVQIGLALKCLNCGNTVSWAPFKVPQL